MMVDSLDDQVLRLNNEANRLANLDKLDEAVANYKSAIILNPTKTKQKAILHYNAALSFFRLKQYKEAKKHIEVALSSLPEEYRFLYVKGLIAFLTQQEHEARECFEQARTKGHGNYSFCLIEAELLRRELPTLENSRVPEEKKRRPHRLIEDAIAQDRSKPHAYVHLGELILEEDGRRNADQAEEKFRFALTIDEHCIFALFNLGLLYYEEQDYLKAAESFQRITDIDSNNTSSLYNLAVCKQLLGQFDSAISNFRSLATLGYRNGNLDQRVRLLVLEANERQQRFRQFEKWINKLCEAAEPGLYLNKHPRDVLAKVEAKFNVGEVPYYLRIAALSHDIERAFPDRVRKQTYGLDEERSEVSKSEWDAVYSRFRQIMEAEKIDEKTWQDYFCKGRLKNTGLRKVHDILYDLYKSEHCRNSAEKLRTELLKEGWDNDDIERAYELVLHHEEGFTKDGSHSKGDETLVNYLINSDAASFLVVNLSPYLYERGLIETDKKTRWSIDRLKRIGLGLMEISAIVNAAAFMIECYNREISGLNLDESARSHLQQKGKYWIDLLAQYKSQLNTLQQATQIKPLPLSIDRERFRLRYDLDINNLPFKSIDLPF